jgi:hypothetical protein
MPRVDLALTWQQYGSRVVSGSYAWLADLYQLEELRRVVRYHFILLAWFPNLNLIVQLRLQQQREPSFVSMSCPNVHQA